MDEAGDPPRVGGADGATSSSSADAPPHECRDCTPEMTVWSGALCRPESPLLCLALQRRRCSHAPPPGVFAHLPTNARHDPLPLALGLLSSVDNLNNLEQHCSTLHYLYLCKVVQGCLCIYTSEQPERADTKPSATPPGDRPAARLDHFGHLRLLRLASGHTQHERRWHAHRHHDARLRVRVRLTLIRSDEPRY